MRSTRINLAGVIGYPGAIYFPSVTPFKGQPGIYERPAVVFNYTWRTNCYKIYKLHFIHKVHLCLSQKTDYYSKERPVCGLLQPANRTHDPQLHTISTT